MDMALISMALVSGIERDAIFLENLNRRHGREAKPDFGQLPKFTEGSNGNKIKKIQYILHDFFIIVDFLHSSTFGEMIVP